MTAHTSGPPAIVLGGRENALAVARSLGRRGIAVHALADKGSTLTANSRYVTSSLAPGRVGTEEAWTAWLDAGPGEGVLIPCGDLGLEYLARNRARLEGMGYTPIEMCDDVTLAMLDKERTNELARACGVDVPRTRRVRTREEATAVAQDFEYPCAVKPCDSYRFRAIFGQKAFVVSSAAELEAAFDRILPSEMEVIVTEIITGPGGERFGYCSYYSYLDADGEPLFHFTKLKPREYPLVFGGGTYHVSKWDPEVAEVGLRFFQGVGLRGIGNVEFKRDGRDGRLKLIECNPRITAADRLVQLAGLDLSYLAYRRALGLEVEPFGSFRDGVREWYPYGDFLAFRDARRQGLATTTAWLRSVAYRQCFPFFDWRDPGPTLANTKSYLRSLLPGRRAAGHGQS